MAGTVRRVRYVTLCPKGTRMQAAETRECGEVVALSRKVSEIAGSGRSDLLPRLQSKLEKALEARDDTRVELSRHVAHCTDGCASPPSSILDNQYSRAPHQLMVEMPGAGTLAAMLREGQTAEGLAAVYGRAVDTIRQVVSVGGYNSVSGKPRAPKRATVTKPVHPLLAALASRMPDWYADALCAQVDPDLFYPEPGGSTREAKQVCSRCPVTAKCLEYAVANNERHGVWGGVTERNRRRADLLAEAS